MTIFETISVVVALPTLFVLIWQTNELRLQLRANFHQEFCRRYTEVLKSFPIKALDDNNLSLRECIYEKNDFKVTLQLYFWIVQEEYNLNAENRLPKGQWEIWDKQFRIMMQNRWLREGWCDLYSKLAFPDHFRKYVETVLSNDKKHETKNLGDFR